MKKRRKLGKNVKYFYVNLKEYKEKSLYMSTDEFLWHLYIRVDIMLM